MGSARSRGSTDPACLIRHITMRCSTWIGTRRSFSSATMAYGANRPPSTSGVRGSVISTIYRAASKPGHCSSIPPSRVTKLILADEPKRQRPDMSLLIDFASPTALLREQNRTSTLPIIGNGPPGTFVLFPNGLRVSLPTHQIVFADDTSGHVRVGFGGMRFVGFEGGRLVFVRIRELFPEDQLSQARSHTMRLDPQWVATISVDGRPMWWAGSHNESRE